jgi:hypothetical protein
VVTRRASAIRPAILVGDLCLVWGDQLMARALCPPRPSWLPARAYDQMRVEAISGQYLDVLGENAPVWTVGQALRTARLKTAGYTVARAAAVRAVLAGHPDPAVSAAFDRYGLLVGEAFQLRDDLLGAFGSPEVTGKPAGDDLVSGKPTVLLQLARDRASPPQLTELEDLLHRCSRRGDQAGAASARRLAELVLATGAADQVESMITERVLGGCQALDSRRPRRVGSRRPHRSRPARSRTRGRTGARPRTVTGADRERGHRRCGPRRPGRAPCISTAPAVEFTILEKAAVPGGPGRPPVGWPGSIRDTGPTVLTMPRTDRATRWPRSGRGVDRLGYRLTPLDPAYRAWYAPMTRTST